MDRFQKNPIDDNMLLNSCAKWNKRGSFPKTHKLLLYAIQLVCVLKWNKRDSFQKKTTPIYYIMLFNLCAYWNQTRWTDFKKIQLMTICYWTRVRNESRGAVFQKHTNYYCMLFNLCAYWNETRGIVFKKKTPIYYIMLFNLCAYWNQTRWTDFKKIQLMTICYWTRVRNESRGAVFQKHTNYYSMLFNLCAYWNETRGPVFKKIQLMTICYWTRVRNETRGAVYKKQQFITAWYSTCVRIEMKQEGQFQKKNKNTIYYSMLFNKRGSFQKNPIDDNMILNLCTKWNKRGSFQKTTIYYCMLFNLCAYWNETRGIVFKKTTKTPIY